MGGMPEAEALLAETVAPAGQEVGAWGAPLGSEVALVVVQLEGGTAAVAMVAAAMVVVVRVVVAVEVGLADARGEVGSAAGWEATTAAREAGEWLVETGKQL